MSLEALQSVFEEQIQEFGYIIISTASLEAAGLIPADNFDRLISSYLMLDTPLTVTTQTIPAPIDNTLSIAGTASFLNLTNLSVNLVFTIDVNNITQLLLQAELDKSWSLTSSFTNLSGYPVTALDFNSSANFPNPAYLFTTQQTETIIWNQQSVSLAQGLNFAGYLVLSGSLTVIEYFVPSANDIEAILLSGTINSAVMDGTDILYPIVKFLGSIPGEVTIPGFTVEQPSVYFSIDTETDIEAIANVDFKMWLYFMVILKVKVDGDDELFQFRLVLLENSSLCVFSLVSDPEKPMTIEAIVELIGGENFLDEIPSVIRKYFLEAIALKGLNSSFYLPAVDHKATESISCYNLTVGIGTTEAWKIYPFEIKNIDMVYTVTKPFSKQSSTSSFFNATFEFYPELFHGVFLLEMNAAADQLAVSARYQGSVSLNDIVKTMSGGTVTIPKEFMTLVFSDFGVSFVSTPDSNSSGNQSVCKSYSFYAMADASFSLAMLAAPDVTSHFELKVNWTAATETQSEYQEYILTGGINIGNSYFSGELYLNNNQQLLTAKWEAVNNKYLGINDLVTAFGFKAFLFPPGLDLQLKSATFTYDFINSSMVFEAISARYGDMLFMSQKLPEGWEYIFIFNLKISRLSIDELPLFGHLPAGQQIALDALQINGASAPMTAMQMQTWQTMLDAADVKGHYILPPSITHAGASITAEVTLGISQKRLFLPLSTSSESSALLQPLANLTATTTPALNPQTIWFTVQNSLGPIYLNRIGFAYQGDRFCILLDAALKLTNLQLDVMGFGVSVDLADITNLHFSLLGLGVDYQQAPLQISGGLLRVADQNGGMAFEGQAMLALPDLKILALGAYNTLAGTNDSSLFVFALLNKIIGGPPYFYVTGLSAGFGYNRELKIPQQSDVQNFPLVAGLSTPSALGGPNPTPNEALATLEEWTPPRQGQYWFGIGIQASTFEIINTNALFVVQFGHQTVVSIIGISTLRQPQKGTAFTYATLNLVANFMPDQGEVNVKAALAPGAFVLTKDAHLKGGFAFSSWFDNNIHAGEFVFVMGGYGSHFKPPSYYPQVAPLAIDWKVNSLMTFTGSAYFAMVPSAMMAGTNLELAYHAGALKAWLKAKTDVILYWQPFYFIADVSIKVGVSLRIKVLFVHKTLSVEVGSQLHLWGPEMGGKVKVDWSVLSFTISFGAGLKDPGQNITWQAFQEMLPSKTMQTTSGGETTTSTPSEGWIYINPDAGLLSQQTVDNDSHWLVRASDFKASITAAIPASQILVQSADPTTNYTATGKPVGMCRVEGGISPEDYQCEQTISITQIIAQDPQSIHDRITTYRNSTQYNVLEGDALVDLSQWQIELVEKKLPSAMWSDRSKEDSIDVHKQTVAGTVGIKISPKTEPMVNGTPAMTIEEVFSYTVVNETDDERLPLDPDTIPEPIIFYQGDSFEAIANINATSITDARTQVYDLLTQLGIQGLANDALPQMAQNPGGAFVDEPRLGTTYE